MEQANFYTVNSGEETLRTLDPAVLFIVTRQRNAWWGRESSQYKGSSDIATNLQEAKEIAENWRQKGSQFTIQEIPALVIHTDTLRIALVEFHNDNSFGRCNLTDPNVLKVGAQASYTLTALGPWGIWKGGAPDEHSFVYGVLRESESVKAPTKRKKFRAWSSHFEGVGYYIRWIQHPGRHKAGGVMRIYEKYLAMNSSPGLGVHAKQPDLKF